MSCACLHDVDCTLAMQNVALEDENARLRTMCSDVLVEIGRQMVHEGLGKPAPILSAAEVREAARRTREYLDAVLCLPPLPDPEPPTPWPVYPSPFDWPR